MKKHFYTLLVPLLISLQTYSQKARMDTLIDKKLYQKNIKVYKEVLKHGFNLDISLKLADALRKVERYEEASEEYGKVIDKPGINPIHYKHYSEVLCAIGEQDDCQRWLLRYTEYVKRSDQMVDATIEVDTSHYFLNRVPFNSVETDFGPSFYKKGIIYISAYSPNSKITVHEGTGESFYKFYYAERNPNGTFQTPVQTFKSVNTTMYEGPVSLTSDDASILFVRNNLSELKAKSRNKNLILQLVEGKVKDDEIIDIKDYPYDDHSHTCTHPSISSDGKELYFASNMDSTQGGSDIFVSRWQNGKWGPPEDLGPIVNTAEDEVYPFIAKDGKLYFASAGHGSTGGLDIYVTQKVDGKWIAPVNLGAPFNTIFDDFSFIVDSHKKEGFLSSNRATSLGSDDIFYYYHVYKDLEEQRKYRPLLISLVNKDNFNALNGNKIKGKLVAKDSSSLSGKVVQLLDDAKNIVKRCYLSDDGYFSFSGITPANYLLVFEDKPVDVLPSLTLSRKPVLHVELEDINRFKIGQVFKDSLQKENNGLVVGKLVTKNAIEKPSQEVVSLILVDGAGNVLKRIQVGKESYFVFRNLKPDDYYVLTEDNNPIYTCTMSYYNPDETKSLYRNGLLEYHFKHLTSDSLRENNLILHGKVKGEAEDRSTVLLLDANDHVVGKTSTNGEGFFVFRELDGEDMHLLVLNNHQPRSVTYQTVYQKEDSMYHVTQKYMYKKLMLDESLLKNKAIINGRLTQAGKPLVDRMVLLLDKNNQVVNEAFSNKEGYFAFHMLTPDDYYLVVNEREPNYALETRVNLYQEDMCMKKEVFQKFNYKKLKGELPYALEGRAFSRTSSKPLEDQLLLLLDKEGKVVDQVVSSSGGYFKFKHILPEEYTVIFHDYHPDQKIEWKVVVDAEDSLVYPEAKKQKLPVNEGDVAIRDFVLLFEYNSVRIKDRDREKLKVFLSQIKTNPIQEIEILGFTDMAGSDSFNLLLSDRRIGACKMAIVPLLPSDEVKIVGIPKGRTNTFLNKKGVYEPALNRRVEIRLKH